MGACRAKRDLWNGLAGAAGLTTFAAAVAVGGRAATALAGEPVPKVIAATGLAVPGEGGATYARGLGTPSINNAGQVTFLGGIGTEAALFLGSSAGDVTVIERGSRPDPAGGGSDSYLNRAAPVVNDAGSVLVRYSATSGRPGLFFRPAGGGAAATYATIGSNDFNPLLGTFQSLAALNDSNVALLASKDPSAGPPSPSILRFEPGGVGVTTFVTAGQAAPGQAGLVLQGFSGPLLNSSGTALFRATLADGSTGVAAGSAVYLGASAGALTQVARSGDAAPGSGAGVTFADLDFAGRSLNAAGQAIFTARLNDPSNPAFTPSGVYRYTPGGGGGGGGGTTRAVVRSGQALPVAGGTFGDVRGTPVLTADGRVVVRDVSRIYVGTSAGDLRAVGGTGVAAPPELPAGTRYEIYNPQPFANNRGQVVFVADLLDATAATNLALFAWDPDAGLHMILREGDAITVAPGDVRTVLGSDVFHNSSTAPAFDLEGPYPDGGLNRSLNDDGLLAVSVLLTSVDTSQAFSSAVITLQAPEPGTAGLLMVGALPATTLLGRRRRRRTAR